MKLLIVESPAKAKTISKYLDNKYTVRASIGHIRDLPKSSKNAIDIEGGFKPNYEISKGKEKVVHELEELAAKADEVVLATDPDREGEAIAWHVAKALKLDAKKAKRITFNEITKDAVKEAMEHPRTIDQNLRKAQEARRVLDRLVGYDLSGLIWKKVRYGLSAGRVQSPALRIIMEREREIRAFDPEDYWVITADVKPKKGGDVFLLTCSEEPRDKELVSKIEAVGKKEPWVVQKIKETETQRKPRPPFKTSTLQQTASTRLGFAPSRTMRVAQKLYEQGHITYMRTDSTNLSKQAVAQALKVIEKEYGKEYAHAVEYKTTSKNAQEAHEAIRPSNLGKMKAGTTEEQKELYALIWARTIASQMTPAKVMRTKVEVQVGDGSIPNFSVNGSRTLFPGWLKADPAAKGEDVEVPQVEEGDLLALKEMYIEEKQTQPPNRYSEAGLVKELEKRGIGRPSTYASIMQTLQNRGYVEKIGTSLHPTDTGDVVSSFLENYFGEYIDDTFTADMEDKLDDIATGERDYKKTLSEFYKPFKKDIEDKEDIPKLTNLGPADKKFKCPECGKPMVIKLGRGGKFLSCSTYPDCEGALTIDGHEIKEDEPIGLHPDTKEPIFILTGRFGPYVQLGVTPEVPKGSKIKKKDLPKPRRASIPKEMNLDDVTLDLAVKWLSLPRELGVHPKSGEPVIANAGRFGPYVGHDGEFRSLKKTDDVYTVNLDRALELLAEEKKPPRGAEKIRDIGKHPKTKKMLTVFKSKSGLFLMRGIKRIYLPDTTDVEALTIEEAVAIMDAS